MNPQCEPRRCENPRSFTFLHFPAPYPLFTIFPFRYSTEAPPPISSIDNTPMSVLSHTSVKPSQRPQYTSRESVSPILPGIFFLFVFLQVSRLYATIGVMTDFEGLLRTKPGLACAPSFSMSALFCRCD